MSDDIESAFVEIAAQAREVDAAAERLVPLYEDRAPAGQPETVPPLAAGRGLVNGCAIALLIALAVAGITFAFIAAHA